MTRAPTNLLQVRTLLLGHLGLDPAAVGIVGDANHRGGYHCGSDRVVSGDYSVVESPRDSSGLTLDAAALDVGQFTVRSGGGTHDLRSFSRWCAAECAAGAPDTLDIREIIYSPDGVTVVRWDRLRKRISGDSSHRGHTHFSFFRDAIKAGRDLRPLFRRYLRVIGLIPSEDDMTPAQMLELLRSKDGQAAIGQAVASAPLPLTDSMRRRGITATTLRGVVQIAAQYASDARQAAGADVDEQAIVAGVLAGLSPAAIAAAIPQTIARQVADELAARLRE